MLYNNEGFFCFSICLIKQIQDTNEPGGWLILILDTLPKVSSHHLICGWWHCVEHVDLMIDEEVERMNAWFSKMRKSVLSSFVLSVLIVCLMLSTVIAAAGVVWGEDFEDWDPDTGWPVGWEAWDLGGARLGQFFKFEKTNDAFSGDVALWVNSKINGVAVLNKSIAEMKGLLKFYYKVNSIASEKGAYGAIYVVPMGESGEIGAGQMRIGFGLLGDQADGEWHLAEMMFDYSDEVKVTHLIVQIIGNGQVDFLIDNLQIEKEG